MAATEVEEAPPPAMPEYMTDPNAVLKDFDATWRYGQPPDYSKTRSYYEQTKQSNHEPGGLLHLVENLVKNWEVEASFKTKLSDWRTIDQDNYSFSINGGPSQSGEDMLKNGTYNAIIQPGNEYYCPRFSDFSSSHKTFKRMMPTFAWEVLDVVGAPPKVAVKWRHWGVMKNDYVGFNNKGEQVTAKAHGRTIDIQGTTWTTVNDKLQVTNLETWFDPVEMFRQIAADGIVNKATVSTTDAPQATASVPDASATSGPTISTDVAHDSETGSPTSEASYVKVDMETHKRPAKEEIEKLHEDSKAAQEATMLEASKPHEEPEALQEAILPQASKASEETKAAQEAILPKAAMIEKEEPRLVSTGAMSIDEVAPAAVMDKDESQTIAFETTEPRDVSHPIDISTMTVPGTFPSATENANPAGSANGEADPPQGEEFSRHARLSHGPEVTMSQPDNAMAVPGSDIQTQQTHEEMSTTTTSECPFMNKE